MSSGAFQAVSFGLVASISWGLSDFLGARAAKKFGGVSTAFFVNAVSAVLYGLLYVICMRGHTQVVASAVIYALAAGIAYACAMASFFKGLELGPVSIVSPLGSMYPLITVLLLILAFGNTLRLIQGVGILLVIGGAALASGMVGRRRTKDMLGIGPFFGVGAALCWGVTFALLAQAISKIGWQFAMLLQVMSSAVTFLLLLPLIARRESVWRPSLPQLTDISLLGASLLQLVGFLAVSVGIGQTASLAAVVVAVSACYPLITVFLAIKQLHEVIRPIPLAGAVVGIAGIVVLALG